MTKSRSNRFKDKSGVAVVLTDCTKQARLERILRTAGYRVHSFTIKPEFISSLAEFTPTVLLVDVRFDGGDYKKGLEVVQYVRKWKARHGNSPFPVVVCVAALWNPVQEEELRKQGAGVAWLSDRSEILHRIQYGQHIARSAVRQIPYFRIIFENPAGRLDLTDESVLRGVLLVDDNGSEDPVPLSLTPMLILVYLLLRSDLPQNIADMCDNLNSIPFYYSSGATVRVFTYKSLKMDLHRIRKSMKTFLIKHGFSFSKVWLEESMDGDERTTGIRIKARHEIDVRTNETVRTHGFKL